MNVRVFDGLPGVDADVVAPRRQFRIKTAPLLPDQAPDGEFLLHGRNAAAIWYVTIVLATCLAVRLR